MPKLNVAQLVAAVKDAPPSALPEMNEGTSYLFNKIYRRLASDGYVLLSDLDFNAFELEDLSILSSLYDHVFERYNCQASGIAGTLRGFAPVCKTATYV